MNVSLIYLWKLFCLVHVGTKLGAQSELIRQVRRHTACFRQLSVLTTIFFSSLFLVFTFASHNLGNTSLCMAVSQEDQADGGKPLKLSKEKKNQEIGQPSRTPHSPHASICSFPESILPLTLWAFYELLLLS